MSHIHDKSKLRSTGSKDGSHRKAATIEDASPVSSSPDNSQVKPNHGKHGDKAIQLRPKIGTQSVGRLMLALSRLPKTKALDTKHLNRLGSPGAPQAVFRACRAMRYFESSFLARCMSSASTPVLMGVLENHASKISFATAVDVLLRLIAKTLASSHRRAPFAVSASQHRAARVPGTLLAAIVTPVPVQQKTIPWSALPLLTSIPIFSPTSGQPIASPFSGPDRVIVWPLLFNSSTTKSVRTVFSSLPTEIFKSRSRTRCHNIGFFWES